MGIILLGLMILLLIKYWIWRKDRIEYAKFLQQENDTQYQEDNPLYKSAVSKFSNPLFKTN